MNKIFENISSESMKSIVRKMIRFLSVTSSQKCSYNQTLIEDLEKTNCFLGEFESFAKEKKSFSKGPHLLSRFLAWLTIFLAILSHPLMVQ